MMMTTNFQLMDEVDVHPTRGLDAARGVVRIVAVTCFEALPDYVDYQAYFIEEESYDQELRASAWYGFRYLDEELHKGWGISYLPESLFQELVDAASSPA